jgi:hypothetical protein
MVDEDEELEEDVEAEEIAEKEKDVERLKEILGNADHMAAEVKEAASVAVASPA